MREIKFRAWNIKEKRMIYNIQQEYDGFEEDCFAQFIEQEGRHGRRGKIDKYKVMQYIGIKDLNDQEIYEGDILKSDKSISTVSWEDVIDQDYYWGNACGWSFDFHPKTMRTDIFPHYEIIGNIYENPKIWDVNLKF